MLLLTLFLIQQYISLDDIHSNNFQEFEIFTASSGFKISGIFRIWDSASSGLRFQEHTGIKNSWESFRERFSTIADGP